MSVTLSTERKRQFKEAFMVTDVDGSGKADLDELVEAVKGMGMAVSREDMKGLMDTFDADKSGEIDFDEFFDLMVELDKRHPQDSEELIRSAFGDLKSAQGSEADSKEIRELLMAHGPKLSAEEVDALLEGALPGVDGGFDYEKKVVSRLQD